MASITIGESTYYLKDDETVLEALIRNDVEVRNSCRAGLCQSCVMKAVDGDVSADAQKGLDENQKKLKYFLSCQCRPRKDLNVSFVDQSANTHLAEVVAKELLSDSVILLRIKAEVSFKAGQYLTLWKNKEVGRTYSISSLPDEGFIECHVKIHQGGKFSTWVKDELEPGDKLEISDPMGLCFYQAGSDQPMLLAAVSTGLSPIMGVLKDALKAGHLAPIELIFGASFPPNFYMVEELKKLEQQHERLKVHFVVKEGLTTFAEVGDVYQTIGTKFPVLNGYKVYLCGAPSFVSKMKKICFINGASMTDIHADSFECAASE